MKRLLIRRLILVIPITIGVSILIFLIMRLIPGDPAVIIAGEDATPEVIAQIRKEFHLDDPLPIQYLIFMEKLLKGDVRSIKTKRPIFEELVPRFLNTLELAIFSMVIAIILGMSLGVIAAVRRNSWIDNAVMTVALIGVSMPVFWLGILLMLAFSVYLGWFPAGGKEGFKSLILPSLTIGLALMGYIARMTRTMMIEVLTKDFIKTAISYGIPKKMVVYKYALKNVLIPIVTLIGLQFGYLLGGAVLTESVFGWPGIGRYIVDAIFTRDYSVVQVGIMMVSFFFVLINLAVDVLYMLIDPRIRRSSS